MLHFHKVVRDRAGNVVGVMFGSETSPTVVLNSHMDTVTPPEEMTRDSSAYAGGLRSGWLHGLGAADCKGGLAAQVYAAALLRRCLLPLRGNVVVAATVAEENGRSVGVKELMDSTLPSMHIVPSYAVLGEPTGLGLHYGHDGWVEVEVRVEGPSPFLVGDAVKAIAEDLSVPPQDNAPIEESTFQETSFENTGGLHRATVRLERRLRQPEAVDTLVAEVRRTAARAARSCGPVAVDVAVRQENQRLYTGQAAMVRYISHAWTTDPFSPLVERARQALAAAGCEVHPEKWRLGRLGMGTAGAVLVNEYRIPTVGFGPGEESQAHTANECVQVEKMVRAVYGTASIVHALVGVPTYGWTDDEI